MALKNNTSGQRRGAALIGLSAALGFAIPGAAQADAPYGQNNAQNAAAPSATLQVTGTEARFSVSANHADVQDALKLVFDQAGKQFLLDNNVTGQITLRLTEQPLNVALDAICKQTFLRYRYDAGASIFCIERDDAAVRTAFSRLRSLDVSLRDQLRLMGLSLPNENGFSVGQGYGGALVNPLTGNRNFGPDTRNGLSASGRVVLPEQSPIEGAGRKDAPVGRMKNPNAEKLAPQGPPASVSDAAASDATADAATPDLSKPGELQQFLQTNNFVSFRTPAEKPEPVYKVLQNLGQQAKVTVLIDPDVPNGSKFTLRGSISPRPLPEALNILTRYARLEWRWIGNTIFVQTAPDFQIFFGEEKEPRVRYAPAAQSIQRRAAAPSESPDPKADKTEKPGKDSPKTKQ